MNIDKKYLDERLVSLKERKGFFEQQADQMRANAIACDGAMKDTQEILDYLAKEEPKVEPADVPDPEVK
jgi:hypothetical protein